MPQKGKLMTGARARFLLDGVVVGYARTVTVSEAIEYTPIEVMDNIEVAEHVPVAYRVTLTASYFRILNESVKKLNWFPKVGSNTNDHLLNILNAGEMSAVIEDSGGLLTKGFMQVEQVRLASHNWTIDARGVVGEDAEFVAIRVKDESEI
jgi:hypothetical protein